MPEETLPNLDVGISRLTIVLDYLSKGGHIDIGDMYRIAMSTNGDVGYAYGDSVTTFFEVGTLLRVFSKMTLDEWVVIASNIALNKIHWDRV